MKLLSYAFTPTELSDENGPYVEVVLTRICTKCGRELPLTREFFFQKGKGPDKLREACKECCGKQAAAYRAAHPGKSSELARAWRSRNREHVCAKTREWQVAHPEYVKKAVREWREKHRDQYNARSRNYKARKRKAQGSHTAEDIRAIYAQQEGRCFYCGKDVGEVYHVDHYVPLLLGGSNDPDNLRIACPTCNHKKCAKHPDDLAEVLF